jgi:phosphoribosylformylglycinamidine synthase II
MVTRIEIAGRPGQVDPRGVHAAGRIRNFLGIDLQCIRTRDVYRIEADLKPGEAEKILNEFTDPVLHNGAIGRVADGPVDTIVAVSYKPGVTDPVGKSAMVAVQDTLGRSLALSGGEEPAVYTSVLYLLDGVTNEEAELIARNLLANPVIQDIGIQSWDEWNNDDPDLCVPRVAAQDRPAVKRYDLSGSDDDLLDISRKGLLSLSLEEMQTIRDHFKQEGGNPGRVQLGLGGQPTDVELECLAQTWSEHCKHKIFNATVTYHEDGKQPETIGSLFKDYIRGATEAIDAPWLVSVFHDNAGVVTFDEEIHLVYKVETHNSPSALDPYGGAMTGIVGVNRDPFGTGLGAHLLANVWGYCFGSPFHDGELPKGLLHPRRIRDGVHQGVIDGGNQSGIPYGRGWEIFDDRYLGKPLVFCGTVGALPVTIAGGPGEKKAARPGDRIVMTGGRIGADGIHGATFSSAALDESAPVQAVQIGDPITQKKMFDFLLVARERGMYIAITDNGAGGLSSSVGEMAEQSGGARLDLSKALLKYAGLSTWEILLSEAQERMTLAVAPEKIDAFLELAREMDVEACDLGEFTDSGRFHVTWEDETVAWMSMEFMHEGDPDLDLTARWTPPVFAEPQPVAVEDMTPTLLAMIARLNLCSGEKKARHYDHEVKGLTVVKPWIGVESDVPAEATVFLGRHPSAGSGQAPSYRGFVLAEAVNPFLSDIDTYAMTAVVVDEAVRKLICAGARTDRIAALDNFCWPDPVQSAGTPDGEYKMAQLVRSCRALFDMTRAYGTPLISGKDSMKNDSTMGGVKISVPPTLLLSAIGLIDDARIAVTLDFKQEGDLVYLLGETRDECGGSEYFRHLGDTAGIDRKLGEPAPYVGNNAPAIDPAETLPLYKALEGAIREQLVQSAATPARGGLVLALARSAMAGMLGATIDLDQADDLAALGADRALFSESAGRFVITVTQADAERFEQTIAPHRVRKIGTVSGTGRLNLLHGGRSILDCELDAMKQSWKETLDHV